MLQPELTVTRRRRLGRSKQSLTKQAAAGRRSLPATRSKAHPVLLQERAENTKTTATPRKKMDMDPPLMASQHHVQQSETQTSYVLPLSSAPWVKWPAASPPSFHTPAPPYSRHTEARTGIPTSSRSSYDLGALASHDSHRHPSHSRIVPRYTQQTSQPNRTTQGPQLTRQS